MCEFAFARRTAGAQWDLTLPGRVQQHNDLRDVYNGPSRQQHVQQIAAEPTLPNVAASFALSTALLRVILPTADNSAVLGIGPDTLSNSSLKPYEGWAKFRPRILTALAAYRSIAQPSHIERMTLKYINRIVVANSSAVAAARVLADVAPSHDVVLADGATLSAVLKAYNYRKELVAPDKTKIIVTQSTIEPAEPTAAEFLLDIEILWDQRLSFENATPKLDSLHSIEGATFESFVKDEARSLFDAN